MPETAKISELKEQICAILDKKKEPKMLSLLYKGKDLTEDLKTLKDFGMKSL